MSNRTNSNLKPVPAVGANWKDDRRSTADAVAAWKERRERERAGVTATTCAHLNLPRPSPAFLDFSVCPDCGENVKLSVAPLPDTPTPPRNANRGVLSDERENAEPTTVSDTKRNQQAGNRDNGRITPRHVICRTAGTLNVSDGLTYEGGKKELSVRARMQRLGI